MTTPYDPDDLRRDLEALRDDLQRALDIAKTDALESEFTYVVEPEDLDTDDEDLDEEDRRIQAAERAEIVRGRRHFEWWDDFNMFQRGHTRYWTREK